MRLATEDVRNFQCNASEYNGFTLLAWAVCHIFITRFFSRPSVKEWYTAPRFFYFIARRGAEEHNKLKGQQDKTAIERMKKLYLFAIAALLTLQSCTVMKDVTITTRRATYSVSLDKVELPSNSKDRFSETIQKENSEQGVTKYVFEDENIRIFWFVFDEQFSFTIYNKTNHALKINWDDVVYVNTDKSISKMIHSGIKYSKMNDGQVPTTLPKGAKLEDILVPVDNIHFLSNKWTTLPLFPNRFSSDEAMKNAKALEGESVSILLPIKIEDVQNDYTFSFKINKVEVNSTTSTQQVHDYDAEFKRTVNATLWGSIGGVSLIVLIALAFALSL